MGTSFLPRALSTAAFTSRREGADPGADEPVAVYEGAALGTAGRRYPMPDERGSIVGLVNADGTPSAYNSYDPWGIPGAANAGRFQYTGQAWIGELGMYYYKARIYSPTLGRFMQTDPIGYDDQINLYAYVGNDPINHTDPDGTQTTADPRLAVVEYFMGIASDLGDLAEGVAEGRLEWAVGGMPPTLGGGTVSGGVAVARNIPTVVTGTRLASQASAAHRVARAEAAAARAAGNARGATSGLDSKWADILGPEHSRRWARTGDECEGPRGGAIGASRALSAGVLR